LPRHYSTHDRKNLIGRRVRLARLRRNPPITQEELTARLEVRGVHIDRVGISKLENQQRRVTDKELVALAEALNVTVPWLLGEK